MSKKSVEEDIKKNPGRYAGHFFREGNWDTGWKLYTHREKNFWGECGRKTGLPVWKGQDLKNKTIVLGYEQSLGEQIMFASMVPDLLRMGAKVTIEVESRLETLFRRSFPTCNIITFKSPWHPDVKQGDYYSLLGNLGKYLRTKPEDFPKENKYLASKAFGSKPSKPIVGVSWWSPACMLGSSKNVDLQSFTPFTQDSSIICMNLQYGRRYQEPLTDGGVDLENDIDGVAALINICDIIVTISNTVAHIAGALGKTTYRLCSNGPLRHYYVDMPWYPSVINVDKEGTWKETIEKISNIVSFSS